MISSLEQQRQELNLNISTDLTMQIHQDIAQAWKAVMDSGREKVVLLCDSRLRAPLATMLARTVPQLSVVAYDEIISSAQVEPVATVSQQKEQSDSTEQTEVMQK